MEFYDDLDEDLWEEDANIVADHYDPPIRARFRTPNTSESLAEETRRLRRYNSIRRQQRPHLTTKSRQDLDRTIAQLQQRIAGMRADPKQYEKAGLRGVGDAIRESREHKLDVSTIQGALNNLSLVVRKRESDPDTISDALKAISLSIDHNPRRKRQRDPEEETIQEMTRQIFGRKRYKHWEKQQGKETVNGFHVWENAPPIYDKQISLPSPKLDEIDLIEGGLIHDYNCQCEDCKTWRKWLKNQK